jgi:hypothetical protein
MLCAAVLFAGAVLATGAAAQAPVTQTPAQAAAIATQIGLVGTWQLVRFEDTDAKGVVVKRFGEHPKGQFVYDATGHLSINIMRTPPAALFASGDDDTGTDAEVRAAFDGYVAYFGTYRVDTVRNVLTHVVEGSFKPSYTGTDQLRPFKLSGDVLVIGGPKPDGSRSYRKLLRVR